MLASVMARLCLRLCCVFAIVCAGLVQPPGTCADPEGPLPDEQAPYGVVVDPKGRPVAGAMILWEARGRDLFKEYSDNRIPKTDADGRFELPGAAELTVFSLDWQLQTVRVRRSLNEPLKIVMQKGKRVEYRTVDRQGRPIAGIHFYPNTPPDRFFHGIRHKPYHDVLDFLGHRDLIRNQSDANGLFVWENAPDEPLAYQIIGLEVLSQPGGEYGPDCSPYSCHS